VFGPVMLLWFVVIGLLGLISVVQTPGILRSILPTYAVAWATQEPLLCFLALGSVILCVTGAEALFADMGHFGVGPIRLSWFALVSPALYLNYLGQGALVQRDPKAISDPFYLLAPQGLQLPLVLLATVATVIASQAVISGAFSMTAQAVQLRYLPRMTINHTSAAERGQIYVPLVNWILLIAVVGLVLGFQDSNRLASAYGLAVSGTFVITTILTIVVARHKWHVKPLLLIPVAAILLFVDVSFFTANLTKFLHGGWFPLLIALLVYLILMTWSKGRMLLHQRREEIGNTDAQLTSLIDNAKTDPMPGSAIYLTADTRPPLALLQYLRLGGAVHQESIHLAVVTAQSTPFIEPAEQLQVVDIGPGFRRAVLRYGFMQRVDIASVLEQMKTTGLPVSDDTVLIIYTTRVIPTGRSGMMLWRKHVFAFMLRNVVDPATYFRLESGRVIEYTDVARL
jgi:KUP system potassium uptake protein